MSTNNNTGVLLNGNITNNQTLVNNSNNCLSDTLTVIFKNPTNIPSYVESGNRSNYHFIVERWDASLKVKKMSHPVKDKNLPSDTHFGDNQEWKEIIRKICHRHNNQVPRRDMMVGVEEYDLKRLPRTSFPLHCKKGATFSEIGLHGLIRQRMKPNTVEKHLRYARFMETHEIPVNFKEPTFENFMRHMDYREQTGVGYAALRHEWDAMKMFLEAYGMLYGKGTNWHYKPPSKKNKSKPRILPPPQIVHKFMHTKYSTDPYENALYQYIFSLGFLIGWRVPSEITAMTTDDIIINPDGTGTIIITEKKKDNNQRTINPRNQILTSKQQKSFYNWIMYWRPKVAKEISGNALFLWPSGKPVTTRRLGHKLSEHGKKIWPYFQPYDMRRWCAVARLIETKVETGSYDEYEVYDWLGHTEIQTTMGYVKEAKKYYRQHPYNWIQRVLRCPRFFLDFKKPHAQKNTPTGTEDNPLNPTNRQKTFLSHGTNRDSKEWEHWDLPGPTDRDLIDYISIHSLLDNLSHFLNLIRLLNSLTVGYVFFSPFRLNIIIMLGENGKPDRVSVTGTHFSIHKRKNNSFVTLGIVFTYMSGRPIACGILGYEGCFSFILFFSQPQSEEESISRVTTTKGSEIKYEWRKTREFPSNETQLRSCCPNRYRHHKRHQTVSC